MIRSPKEARIAPAQIRCIPSALALGNLLRTDSTSLAPQFEKVFDGRVGRSQQARIELCGPALDSKPSQKGFSLAGKAAVVLEPPGFRIQPDLRRRSRPDAAMRQDPGGPVDRLRADDAGLPGPRIKCVRKIP